ncbi:DUF2795 domain-containing protein [Herbidospora galbida]|uniref:DUF2795 domain-containing protein n=1 Tax=Herbidospora galbida TaxID=2575442 RepID=A0A4U3MIA1_9ACTN|nr:DUF2795 domain-containing protein [Herbidospora galbida]TKK88379.1 DUF2795 domain-containing protein [Herbidospora galbida]
MQPDAAHEPGSPEGMTSGEVDSRSELAKWISGTHVFPADRAALLKQAQSEGAPDVVLAVIRSIPDRRYENLQEVADQLGMTG